MKMLLGIAGRARSGKDTIAEYLVQHHGFRRNAFADPLKLAAQQMFGLSDTETWDAAVKEKVIPFWGKSPRELFQLLGTEAGRQVFGDDLWLKRWQKDYDFWKAKCHYVTPDVRFENEATMIRDMGGRIIHVVRPEESTLTAQTQAHASEAGIAYQLGDLVVTNDGSLDELYQKVSVLIQMEEHRLRRPA